MAFMKFYVGTEASVQEHLDGIYLATDTHKIFYNGSAYGGGDVDLSNYATKDDLSGYLPLTGGVLTTTPDNVFDSPYIQLDVTSPNAPWVEIRAAGLGSVNSTWIRETGINIGDYITDGPGYHTFTIHNKRGLYFYNMYGMPGSASFTRSGITIDGKTTSDLLHAAGGTISIDELKSKLNIPDTSALQGAIGTNTYTGANYVSKETNLTDAVLQLDTEIKATNDNLALEHTNAEATYAKKTELGNYLPLSGGELDGNLSVIGDNNLSVDGSIWINGTDSKYTKLFQIDKKLDSYRIYIGSDNRLVGEFSFDTEHCLMNHNSITFQKFTSITSAKKSIINFNGFTISGKTSQDLLHAAGGTISISDLVSQVTIPKATTSTLGGIKVGDGLEITSDGTLNCIIDPGSGSVSWGNITGKPSVFATNIASINDLNSGWDALLKAAPSGYVTRWPSISEVTGKQNLVIKLNGGATEGTNMFTFNGSTAKSLNITASSIGAAASSHTHTKNQITDFPTTWAWGSIVGKPIFAPVATSGSYEDLTDKPTIPSLTGYATQSWVNSQGFAKGSFLPLTGGTLSGDLIRSNSGDVKRAKINNLEISVYDSINTTCKAIMSCTSNYGVVEVGNNLNNKNVHIDANTGITLKGTGVGISLSTGGSSSKFFATDGSVQTINVDNFALKSTTDALTAIANSQDDKISNMKLGMARYTSGTTAQVIKGNEGTVGLSGTPALYFYNGGITTDTVPISNCIRVKDAQCYVDDNGIYFAFPIVSTEDNGLMASKDKQYLNWVVNSQFGTTIGMDEPNLTNLAKISSAANYVKTHLSTFITNNTSAELDVIQVLQGFIVGDNVHLKLAISIQDTESQFYTIKPQSNNNIVATAISSNNDYRAIVDLWFIVNNLNFGMDRKYVLDY